MPPPVGFFFELSPTQPRQGILFHTATIYPHLPLACNSARLFQLVQSWNDPSLACKMSPDSGLNR
jgi:hypothetical protein